MGAYFVRRLLSAIALVLALTLVGEGLRTAFDPKAEG